MKKISKSRLPRTRLIRPMLIGAVLLTATLSSSCANKQLAAAASALGTQSAGINIPPAPPECQPSAPNVPHAAFRKGDNAIAVLKRERNQLDQANGLRRICAEDREEMRKRFNRSATSPQVPQ